MSHLQRFTGSRLNDVELGQAVAQLRLNPIAGIGLAMSEDHGPWGHLCRKIQQLVSIRMGGKIEALQPALAREFAGAVAEMKRLAPTGRAEGASGWARSWAASLT